MLPDMDIPAALPPAAGIGLKPRHYGAVLASLSGSIDAPPPPAWLEVHPQNYFCAGGPPHRWLGEIARHSPLSFHSVGLSLGSAGGLIGEELDALAALCDRYAPAAVSDHLSWSGSADNRCPDLLPLPYTEESLDHITREIEQVQTRLGRPILIENPSRYTAFAHDMLDEVDFLHRLCAASGCGLLLDVNNIVVSAVNLGLDPYAGIDRIDGDLIGEIHLAGHAIEQHEEGVLLIDDHGSAVAAPTWRLFERLVARIGPRPTLIEWDTEVPDYEVLAAEMLTAQAILDRAAAPATSDATHAFA